MSIGGIIVLGAFGLYGLSLLFCLSMELMLIRRPLTFRVPGLKLIYLLALVIGPTAMLLLATGAFESDWKGMKGLGWWGVIHEGYAGAMLFPIWAVSQLSLFGAIVGRERLHKSKPNFLMMGILAAICLWYGYSTLFERFTSTYGGEGDPSGRAMFAMIPLLPGFVLILMMVRVWRRGELSGNWWLPTSILGPGVVASLIAKFYAAQRLFDSLPDVEPHRCFIVTAAASGHPWLVGSRPDLRTGLRENRQLRRMRAFESLLQSLAPRFHRRLRQVYNIVGPVVANRIRTPLAADAIYLALKPLEWAAILVVRVCALGDVR